MAHALVLTASSSGRSSQPSADGVLLVVDGEAPVTIDAWPQPARWQPGHVRLFRGDAEVLDRVPGDNLRWVVTGADRFGSYRAVATDGDRAVSSASLVVRTPPEVVVLPDATAVVLRAPVRTSPGGSGSARTSTTPPAPAAPAPAPPTPTDPGWSSAPAGRPEPTANSIAPGPLAFPSAEPVEVGPTHAPGLLGSGTPASAPDMPPASLASPSAEPPRPTHPSPAPTQRPRPTKSDAARQPAHARPEDLAADVQIPVGEYDRRFAAWVGVAFAVLAGAVVAVAATRLIPGAGWFTPTSATADAAVAAGAPAPRTGTLAERIGLASSTVLLALGCVLMLAGAATAALEVRGRLFRPTAERPRVGGAGAGLRAMPALLDRIATPRATIALLTAGVVTYLAGLVGQLYWVSLF